MYEGNPGEIDFGSSYRESTVLLMMLSLSLINERFVYERVFMLGIFLNIKFCSCLWVSTGKEILHLYAYGSFVRVKKMITLSLYFKSIKIISL